MIELTNSQSDYLKTLYLVSLNGKIRITKIANHLKCSKPSVVRALKSLDELKLVIYCNGEISLTELGKRYARNLVRRSEVLEKFFIEVLKIDPILAKKDASYLKNGVSCYTITKLENFVFKLLGETDFEIEDYCLCEHNALCHNCDIENN